MRQTVNVPQSVIDEHAMVAQTYAGFLVGHPVRAARYTTPLPGSVDIDRTRPWTEPNPVQDDCVFCVRLTDEEAERRVFGFQAAIDKEVLGRKWAHLSHWVSFADEADIPTVIYKDAPVDLEQPDGTTKPIYQRDVSAMSSDHANRRRFIENEQYKPRQTQGGQPRPEGWNTKAASIVSLPLRIKRKMCIDWNHVYTRWMAAESLTYDFDKREFYRDIEDLQEWNDFIGT